MFIVSNGAFKNGSTWLHSIARLVATPRSIPPEFRDPKLIHESVHAGQFERFLNEVNVARVNYLSANHARDANARATLLSNKHVRVLNITRDLRDVLVSAYFHDQREARVNEDIGGYWRGLGRKRIARVVEHHRMWNTGHSQVFVASYEALQVSFESQVLMLATFLGIEGVDTELIKAKTDFRQIRDSKETTDKPFHRKGIVGDWRNHLSPDIVEELADLATTLASEPRNGASAR